MTTAGRNSERKRRETLESLRSTGSVGPSIHGLNDTDQILVAEFYNRQVCQRFRNTLAAHGISSSIKSNRIKVSVYVGNTDREQTFDLLDEHRSTHPDKRPVGIRRDYDATFLCALVGIFGGIALLGVWQDSTLRAVACIGSSVSGLCVGSVLDRCRRNRLYFGRFRFSVAEILILTAVIAALLAFWTYVFQI